MSNHNTVQITVPSTEIADPAGFEAMRVQLMSETTTDAAGREANMRDLVEIAESADGTPLFDMLLERADATDMLEQSIRGVEASKSREAQAAALLAGKAATEVMVYQFNLDPETHQIKGIFKTSVLSEDTLATQASQRISDRTPYGKSSNTFRIGGGSGNYTGRRTHR